MKSKMSVRIRYLAIVGMFSALAYVIALIHFPVAFLNLDVKDAVITLCGLAFGPISALVVSVLVPLLELTVSHTGIYGLIMNILGSVSFSLTVSMIYKAKKNLLGAVVGLLSGAFTMVAVMMLFNLIVTPYYMGVPVSEVVRLIPTLLLPFNLVKAVLNAALVLLLYKPVSAMLQKSGLMPKSRHAFCMDARTVAVMAVALCLVVASLVVIFVVLGGKIAVGGA
jgi:riboflavin transporter FmnP